MLDVRMLRHDVQGVAARLSRRGYTFDVARFEVLEQQRRTLQSETETLQNERNVISKAIGKAKAQKQDATQLLAEAAAMGSRLEQGGNHVGRVGAAP